MPSLWPATRILASVLCLVGFADAGASTAAAPPTKIVTADPAALMDAGHYKRARALVDPRFRANANDAQTLFLEARIKSAFGAPDEAIKLAERALELNKNSVNYHGALASLYGAKAQQAGFLEQISLARKVKQHLDDAIAIDPKNWEARSGLVTYYLIAPGIIGGDKKKAQEIADQAVKDDPSHGWVMQAQIAEESKDNARSEQDYLNALKSDPNSYAVMVALGNFYLRDTVKKYDLAEKYARAAIKSDPTRAAGYALLAAEMVYSGRVNADLDTLLAQAEKADPDDWSPYYSAGRTLVVVGKDFERAERYFRKYLSQEPEGGAPKLAYAHWRIGEIFQKSGKKEQAIAEFETCLRAEPSFEPAKKDLKALK